MWWSRISLFEQALGVADAVEAEVADIGLGGHEGHRHPVADLAAAQLGFEDEGEFIGRAEAGCALHRADDNRAGVLAEGLEGFPAFSAWSTWQMDWVKPSGPSPSISSKASSGPVAMMR